MNRFEQAVYDCMIPTAELLERTTEPLHRAILLNFWRHVHLEGAGEYERILAPDMMVDQPVYRVTWGANPAVIEGKEGVLAFYNSVGEAVLWHSDDRLAVADWGICDEITFHQLARARTCRRSATTSTTRTRSTTWPAARRSSGPTTTGRGSPASTSTRTRRASRSRRSSPDEAITPARVREIHREQLAKLEAERGRPLLGAGERMSTIALEPVDRVEITVLMDNLTDALLVDQDGGRADELAQGPARRASHRRRRA